METFPTSIPYEDERYKWDYDDCGVLCRYDKETEAWEVMEDQCIDCGHRPDDCDCEDEMKLNPDLGFETEDGYWVCNPYVAIGGRFKADPLKDYGKTHDDLLAIFKSQAYLDWLEEILRVIERDRDSLVLWGGFLGFGNARGGRGLGDKNGCKVPEEEGVCP